MLSKLRTLLVAAACMIITLAITTSPTTAVASTTPAPENFHVTSTGFDEITLGWSPGAGADFYRVLVDGAWRAGVYDPTTGVTVTQLKPGTSYTFEVQAQTVNGEFGDGATLQASTLADNEPPAAPTGLREIFDAAGKSVGLAWNASTDNWGVSGTYTIYADDRIAMIGGTPAEWLWLTDPYHGGLSCGTTYTFTVQAWDHAGHRSSKSAPLRATTPRC